MTANSNSRLTAVCIRARIRMGILTRTQAHIQMHVHALILVRILCGPALLAVLFLGATGAAAQVSLRTVVEMAQHNSSAVRLASADAQKAAAILSESRDIFIPSIYFGSGLPAFPEVGYTGSLPTIWDANVQSMVFGMGQIRNVQAARVGYRAAELSLKDAREQAALDASDAYIELDTVTRELEAAREQENDAGRLVAIEQQRAEAGVDSLSQLLQAKLAAAEIKLNRLHLETRAATLAKQISVLTGLPSGSIITDHSSIPQIPTLTGDTVPAPSPALDSAEMIAHSKALAAKGDKESTWTPTVAFGVLYNRNTTLLNNINQYFPQNHPIPANNLSSGFSINLPLFSPELRAHARESAADALRAKVEAEEAKRQNELQIVELDRSLRELDTEAEIASLKQQIAQQQLNAVRTELKMGTGAGTVGAQQPVSPQAQEQASIDERQKYEDALDAGLQLSKARLSLLRALGHMQDWLDELESNGIAPLSHP